MKVPAFRRTWWGYSVKDVDRYLQETADERRRLQSSLTRVETLLANWQCGPEAILAPAHREAPEIRASARRESAPGQSGRDHATATVQPSESRPERLDRELRNAPAVRGTGISEVRSIPEVQSSPEVRVPEPRTLPEPRVAELRTVADVRATPERSTAKESRTAPKADSKVQVISLNSTAQYRDLGAAGDSSLPSPRFATFRSEGSSASSGPTDFMPERGLTESDLNAIDALERSRAGRQRKTRRTLALVGSGVLVLAAIAFAFSDTGAKSAADGRNAGKTPSARSAAGAARPGAKPAATAGGPSKTSADAPAASTPQTLMLTISALKPCWIRTIVDGGQQMERVLQANDTVMLHATNEVLLRVGDASALSLLVNNRPIRALGRSGEVVTQLITRENYASLLQPES